MNTRIAIAVFTENEEPQVAEHFSQCDNFTVYEVNEKLEIIREENYFNPLAGQHTGSCQIPGYVSQFNVDVIIAGGMGQKAINKFIEFGIKVVTAPGLVCNDALNLYITGQLQGYSPCEHEHSHGHSGCNH